MFNDPTKDYIDETARLCRKYPSITAAIISASCMGCLPTDEQAKAGVEKIDRIIIESL